MRCRRNQILVYWAPLGFDVEGRTTFDDPVEIDCRWEDRQELFIDRQGNEVRSNAVFYPETVVKMGGYAYLGTLALLSSAEEGDPTSIAEAREIRSVLASPNLKATETFYKAWL